MRHFKNVLIQSLLAIPLFGIPAIHPAIGRSQGVVDIDITDRESGESVPARILFTKSLKKLSRPKKILFSGDQWLVEKNVQLTPPNGDYEFIVKRGPEFSEIVGGFTIEPRAKDTIPVTVPRAVDMHAEHCTAETISLSCRPMNFCDGNKPMQWTWRSPPNPPQNQMLLGRYLARPRNGRTAMSRPLQASRLDWDSEHHLATLPGKMEAFFFTV